MISAFRRRDIEHVPASAVCVSLRSRVVIKTYLFSGENTIEDVEIADWRTLTEGEGKLLWVDVRSITQHELELLQRTFNLHDLAVGPVMGRYRRPHLYQFADHFCVNLVMIRRSRSNHGIKPVELHVFVGNGFILTTTRDPADPPADSAIEEYKNAPLLAAKGPMHALYLLAEDLVETYYPLVDKLDDDADKIEDILLDHADEASLRRNFALKNKAFELRKLLGPQRDILNDLSRRDFGFIDTRSQVYFQDIYNRMTRLFDILDTVREILSGNLEIYLSTVSNRLNEVVKILTVFATILGVATFVTGFYGMNFRHMPGAESPHAFRNILIFIVVISLGMLFWFRRMKWV